MEGKGIIKFFQFPRFKYPHIVRIATIIAVAMVWLTTHHQTYLDGPSFQLSMGISMLYLSGGSLALRRGAGNTAVYIVFLGIVLLMAGFTFTDVTSIAALATDAIVPQIIGLIGGLFASAFADMVENGKKEGD